MKRAEPGSSEMTEHVGYQQWRTPVFTFVSQDIIEFSHFPLTVFSFEKLPLDLRALTSSTTTSNAVGFQVHRHGLHNSVIQYL